MRGFRSRSAPTTLAGRSTRCPTSEPRSTDSSPAQTASSCNCSQARHSPPGKPSGPPPSPPPPPSTRPGPAGLPRARSPTSSSATATRSSTAPGSSRPGSAADRCGSTRTDSTRTEQHHDDRTRRRGHVADDGPHAPRPRRRRDDLDAAPATRKTRRPTANGPDTGANMAYHWLVLTVCLSAVLLVAWFRRELWWLVPVAAFSYSLVLLARFAAARRFRGWTHAYVHGQGGSYIALVTALVVVALTVDGPLHGPAALIPWVLPTITGTLLIEWW